MEVFVIPHSHCDPGWLQKYESKTYLSHTTNTLNAVVRFLQDYNVSGRFVWSEISYFSLWFEKQTPLVQEQVRTMAKEGRLEFVGGGWVQPDEAINTASSVVDQVCYEYDLLHLGHR